MSSRNRTLSLRLAHWTFAAFAAGMLYAPQAHAFLHLSALGVGYSPMATATQEGQDLTMTNKFHVGFGALLGIGFAPGTELESGIFYTTRDTTAAGTIVGVPFTTHYSIPTVEVPLDLRIGLSMFYVKAGLYGELITGEVTTDSGTESLSDAELNPWDFGALLGAGVDIPLGPGLAITAGAQYQYQLDNSANAGALAADSTAKFHFNALLFTAGVRLGF